MNSCNLYAHKTLLRCGQIAVYRAVIAEQPEWPEQSPRNGTLSVRFVKVASRAFDVKPRDDVAEKSILAEQKRVVRLFIPFVTSPSFEVKLAGVFFTGDHPCWILAKNRDGVKIHSCGYSVVNSFTACSLWESKGDFLMYTDEVCTPIFFSGVLASTLTMDLQGPCLLEWMPNINIGTSMPSCYVSRPRTYTNVIFDANSGLMVVAASIQNRFGLFDEDGNRMWEPDGMFDRIL